MTTGGRNVGEYAAFTQWLRRQFGLWGSERRGYTASNFRQSNVYQFWVAQGRPKAKIPSVEEQRLAAQPYSIAEQAGVGPWYVDEWANPPYTLGPGWEWFKTEYEASGKPIRPQWAPQTVTTPAPVTPEKDIKGYTPEEWEYGVPQWMASQAQAMREENLRAAEVYGQTWQRGQDIQSQQIQAALAGRPQGQNQQLAGEFERARQSILAAAIDPSDWITRWMAENAVNPYIPEPMDEGEQIQQEMNSLTEQKRHWGDVWGSAIEQNNEQLQTLAKSAYFSAAKALGEAEAAAIEYNKQTRPYTPPEVRPTTPPAPGWLPQFAPGQRAGQPITKERIAPPSGQQWTATPESHREGLAGYAAFSGQSFQDLLDRMAIMLPETPRGAGYTRWSPRGQWS